MRFTLNHTLVTVPDRLKGDRFLWILRDHFKLLGPKFGCGIGECGACTIHLNGEAMRSCSLQLEDVEGQDVVTLEGLSTKSKLHPVQSAWIAENVPQCGYCQNGQIMTAVAVLKNDPETNEQTVSDAMDQVRCRCGTQTRIKLAIKRARQIMQEEV